MNKYVTKDYETPDNINFQTEKPEMNIFTFLVTQDYLIYAYPFMESIMDNNDHTQIHLFIATPFPLQEKEPFIKFVEDRGHKLTFYVVDMELLEPFSIRVNSRPGLFGYVQSVLHLIVEEKYDKILSLQLDTITRCDIYTGFYNLDFEGNYLIAATHNKSPDVPFDYDCILNGGSIFNIGVVHFDLKKLREDITYEYVITTFLNNKKISQEQSLMNVLYAKNTKYLEHQKYQGLWKNIYYPNDLTDIQQIKIFHYDTVYVPFKPWLVYFEGQISKIVPKRIKAINSRYRNFVIDDATIEITNWWWEYAKKTPVFDELYQKMLGSRVMFLSVTKKIIEQYNKYSDELETVRTNILTDELNSIKVCARKHKNFLAGINEYYGLYDDCTDFRSEYIDYDETNFNDYMDKINGNKDLAIFISANITAHHTKLNDEILNKIGLKMENNQNEGYIAIIDYLNGKIIEKNGSDILVQSYDIAVKNGDEMKLEANNVIMNISSSKTIPVLLKSEGYNAKTLNSYSSILINNIEYARDIRGLNVVVYSRKRNRVVDQFYINKSTLAMIR